MGDSVKDIVARACDGRYPKMFGENGPTPKLPPVRIPEPVTSSVAEGGCKPLKPSATKAETIRPQCQHTILEISVRPCLHCKRLCNCGFTYFPQKYPDVIVRSLDGHLVQLSGDMVRASETLREMANKYIFGQKRVKLEVNVVLEREENGNFNSILKYWIVDTNEMAVEGTEGTLDEKGNEQVDAQPVVSEQTKMRPSYTNYPIRNSARNFAKLKADVRKMREKEEEAKTDPPAPSTAIEVPSASLNPPITVNNAEKTSRVQVLTFKYRMPDYFTGREFTHRRVNPSEVEKDEGATPTIPIVDLIESNGRNSKVLALFDQQSNRPTLGVCKDILLKIQYFVNMHLDDVERKVDALNRLFQFQDTSSYCSSLFSTVCDMRLSNSFVYADWEEDFFNNLDSRTFFEISQANSEILIWDLYMTLEKWVFLNRGFPQEMVNGFLDLMEEKPDDFDQEDERAALFGKPLVNYPNPYRVSSHLYGRVYPRKLPTIDFKPTWFRITKQL